MTATPVLPAEAAPAALHHISLDEAAGLTKRYREHAGPGAQISIHFDRGIFDAILAQAECRGIRLYRARTEAAEHTLVLVGVDAAGLDMAEGILGEQGWPCPPFCALESRLDT